jgi:CRISPR/Cas system Type II protein with McrA/HNH and RuvC-like nuclease domain
MKEKVLFKSKEYGLGGHNKLELRVLGDGGLRLWVQDGETNSLICMDRRDFKQLAELLAKHARQAPTSVEPYDFSKSLKRKKVETVSDTNGLRKKRKTRSDKGVKRNNVKCDILGEMVGDIKGIDQIKAEAMAEAM